MIRKFWILAIAGFLLFAPAANAVQAVNQGPEQITIFGGSQGKVPFPHRQHQDRLNDCNVCHGIFPQETDAMKKLKEQGALKPKKVMNLQCIRCHKEDKRASKPHGPVTCNTCHIK